MVSSRHTDSTQRGDSLNNNRWTVTTAAYTQNYVLYLPRQHPFGADVTYTPFGGAILCDAALSFSDLGSQLYQLGCSVWTYLEATVNVLGPTLAVDNINVPLSRKFNFDYIDAFKLQTLQMGSGTDIIFGQTNVPFTGYYQWGGFSNVTQEFNFGQLRHINSAVVIGNAHQELPGFGANALNFIPKPGTIYRVEYHAPGWYYPALFYDTGGGPVPFYMKT